MKMLLNTTLRNSIFLFFTLALFSCTKFGVVIAEAQTNEVMPPEMEFFNFSRDSYNTNMKQAYLTATNAKFYTKVNLIHLYDGRGYTYKKEGEVDASAVAEFSIINDKTLFAKLYTNVVIKSSNDTTLYTEYLEYNDREKNLQTPEHIRAVQDDGSWMTGVGMNADLNLEYITVFNEMDEGESFGVPIDGNNKNEDKK